MNAVKKIGLRMLLGLLVAGAALPAAAEAVAAPELRPATLLKHPEKAWLQAITKAGQRLVAVGERGLILYSDDAGNNWRQARVPVAVTLTAVFFASDKQGWAVGHYGTVLHSEDGGESWQRQLDGVTAARLELAAAERQAGDGEIAAKRLAAAQQLVDDGPDKPFFDLYFADDKNGIVVGAYNLAFRTSDGGRTWESLMDRIANPKGNHLYAIRAAGDKLYLVGEQGLVFRSADGGRSFGRLAVPYQGSYFTAAILQSGELVVAGLRGNAYRLVEQGSHWERIELPTPVSVTALAVAGDRLYLANQAGQVYASSDGGRSLQPLATPAMPMLTGLLPVAGGDLIATGLRGIARLAPKAGAN